MNMELPWSQASFATVQFQTQGKGVDCTLKALLRSIVAVSDLILHSVLVNGRCSLVFCLESCSVMVSCVVRTEASMT